MKKRKRLISFGLALTLLLILAMPAAAETGRPDARAGNTVTENGLTFSVENGEATVTGGEPDLTDVEIPSAVTADGTHVPVTAIGDGAFTNCKDITTVQIPGSVVSIGNNVFITCLKLEEVAFDPDTSDAPQSARTPGIGNNTFANTAVQTVSIPGRFQAVGEAAFTGCDALTEVAIGAGITTVGDEAFKDCKQLAAASIPASVTRIGPRAFQYDRQLVEVNFADGVPTAGGYLGYNAFEGCSFSEITIPGQFAIIGTYAFAECKNLAKVTFAEGVQALAGATFPRCPKLTTANLPNSLNRVPATVFQRLGDIGAPLETVNYSGTKSEWEQKVLGSPTSETAGFFSAVDVICSNGEQIPAAWNPSIDPTWFQCFVRFNGESSDVSQRGWYLQSNIVCRQGSMRLNMIGKGSDDAPVPVVAPLGSNYGLGETTGRLLTEADGDIYLSSLIMNEPGSRTVLNLTGTITADGATRDYTRQAAEYEAPAPLNDFGLEVEIENPNPVSGDKVYVNVKAVQGYTQGSLYVSSMSEGASCSYLEYLDGSGASPNIQIAAPKEDGSTGHYKTQEQMYFIVEGAPGSTVDLGIGGEYFQGGPSTGSFVRYLNPNVAQVTIAEDAKPELTISLSEPADPRVGKPISITLNTTGPDVEPANILWSGIPENAEPSYSEDRKTLTFTPQSSGDLTIIASVTAGDQTKTASCTFAVAAQTDFPFDLSWELPYMLVAPKNGSNTFDGTSVELLKAAASEILDVNITSVQSWDGDVLQDDSLVCTGDKAVEVRPEGGLTWWISVRGDTLGEGKATAAGLVRVAEALNGQPLTGPFLAAADFNGNKETDVYDLWRMACLLQGTDDPAGSSSGDPGLSVSGPSTVKTGKTVEVTVAGTGPVVSGKIQTAGLEFVKASNAYSTSEGIVLLPGFGTPSATLTYRVTATQGTVSLSVDNAKGVDRQGETRNVESQSWSASVADGSVSEQKLTAEIDGPTSARVGQPVTVSLKTNKTVDSSKTVWKTTPAYTVTNNSATQSMTFTPTKTGQVTIEATAATDVGETAIAVPFSINVVQASTSPTVKPTTTPPTVKPTVTASVRPTVTASVTPSVSPSAKPSPSEETKLTVKITGPSSGQVGQAVTVALETNKPIDPAQTKWKTAPSYPMTVNHEDGTMTFTPTRTGVTTVSVTVRVADGETASCNPFQVRVAEATSPTVAPSQSARPSGTPSASASAAGTAPTVKPTSSGTPGATASPTTATASPTAAASAAQTVRPSATRTARPTYNPTYVPTYNPPIPALPTSPTTAPSVSSAPTVAPSGSASAGSSMLPSRPPQIVPDTGTNITVTGTGDDRVIGGIPATIAGQVMSVAQLLSELTFPQGTRTEVLSYEGTPLPDTAPIGTGVTVRSINADGSVVDSATVVIPGDVLGTGVMDIAQLVRMARDLNGTEELQGPFLRAADFGRTGNVTIADLVHEARLIRSMGELRAAAA